MAELNIPKGDWTVELGTEDMFAKVKVEDFVFDLKDFGFGSQNINQENAIAGLIADAGTTANKCGKLPSELLTENNELLDFLKSIQKRTQQQSIFDDIEELINKHKP